MDINNDEKIKQILAYLFPVVGGLIFLLLDSSSEKTKYHAAQGLVIGIIMVLFAFIPLIRYFVNIICFVFMILGVVKVLNDEEAKLPIIGDIVDAIWKDRFTDVNKEQKGTKNVKAEDIKTSKEDK